MMTGAKARFTAPVLALLAALLVWQLLLPPIVGRADSGDFGRLVAVLQGPVAVAKGMLLFAFFYDATIVAAVAIVVHRAVASRHPGKHRTAQKDGARLARPE